MAKKQDFLSKSMKLAKHGKSCPVCGEYYNYAKAVDMVPSGKEGSYRFMEKSVGICKCNEKQVYA